VGDLPGAVSPEGAVVTESVVCAALAAMPPRQRACAALCLYSGFSSEEAAAILAISPVTVRVHLHRARRTLHGALSVDERCAT
jgi:RNA polymerase sigma factor (sigma-70 family)